jgi:hypothetical protein
MWIKSYLKFFSLAWEEFKQSKGYGLVRAIHRFVRFIIFAFLGLGILTTITTLYPLLSKLAWLSIGLGIAILILALVVHFLGRHHERIVVKINAEREAERSELLGHAKRVQHLGEIAGRAGQIDLSYLEGEIPEEVLHIWRGLLQTALHHCYGREGVKKFYRNENATEISPAQGKVWFSTHYSRLADFITEQHQAQSITVKTAYLKQ